MRHLVLAVACVFAAGSAFASSIETIATGAVDNRSIATLSCEKCPPLTVRKKTTYIVPQVESGTERVELKELNGEMKLVRTEAWLGGSPVVFVTSPSEDVIKAAQAKNIPAPVVTGATATTPVEADAEAAAVVAIDTSAKTSALGTISSDGATPTAAAMTASREFDPSDYQLRLK